MLTKKSFFYNSLEKNYNLDNDIFFKKRDLIYYLMEEDEFYNNTHYKNSSEFTKNAKKIRMEKELNFIKNIDIVNFNKILLKIFIKNILIYTNYLNILKNLNISLVITKKKYNEFKKLFFYYINFNYNKLNKIKSNNFYVNSENLIVIIDIRYTKPKIFVIDKNKCSFSITSGLIFKKLNLKQKKIKKTEKMLNLMIKSVALKLKKKQFKKCVIHIKGTKSNIFNLIILINKNFDKKNISLLYAPHISYGRFKYKKIKSIKKRLRKKFTKLIKN